MKARLPLTSRPFWYTHKISPSTSGLIWSINRMGDLPQRPVPSTLLCTIKSTTESLSRLETCTKILYMRVYTSVYRNCKYWILKHLFEIESRVHQIFFTKKTYPVVRHRDKTSQISECRTQPGLYSYLVLWAGVFLIMRCTHNLLVSSIYQK